MNRRSLVILAALLCAAAAVPARELKGWSVHSDDYPVNLGMQRFADVVGPATQGRHSARVYANSQLAPQGAVLEKIASGEIDFAEIGILGYGDKVPALRVLGMPYMFHDSAQMFALLDGKLGDLLAAELEKGGVILNVAATSTTWRIEVSDTGIGIPAHALEYIFDEFRQVDGSSQRAYGGTGLGLAISRKLTMMMGGRIQVKSKVGEGSTFTITLPLRTSAVMASLEKDQVYAT